MTNSDNFSAEDLQAIIDDIFREDGRHKVSVLVIDKQNRGAPRFKAFINRWMPNDYGESPVCYSPVAALRIAYRDLLQREEAAHLTGRADVSRSPQDIVPEAGFDDDIEALL